MRSTELTQLPPQIRIHLQAHNDFVEAAERGNQPTRLFVNRPAAGSGQPWKAAAHCFQHD